MCSTSVWKCSLTSTRPRLLALTPAAATLSWSVTPCRPAEYSTVSAGIFLPDSRMVSVPAGCFCTSRTDSEYRKVTARSRSWYCSASTTSSSQKSSMLGRFSTTVTLVPSAAKHGGVLDADDAGADHHHRGRHLVQPEDLVGVDDGRAVEVHGVRPGRPGAHRDHDLLGAEFL